MAGVVRCSSCGKKNRVPVVAKGVPRCAQCKAPVPWLVNADDTDFAEAAKTRLPVLVDLWAPWCGPCRTMAPGLEKLAADMAGELKVIKVNVDESPRMATKYGTRSIPTLVILQDGRKLATQVGALPADRLKAWVQQTVGG